MSEEEKKKEEEKRDEKKSEEMREHVEELHREGDVNKPQRHTAARVIVFGVIIAFIAVWWISSNQQRRQAAAHDILRDMNLVKAEALRLEKKLSPERFFPIGKKMFFTRDFIEESGIGEGLSSDAINYAMIRTPDGLFVLYQPRPTERGVMRELTEMAEKAGLYRAPSVEEGYYTDEAVVPVFMIIQSVKDNDKDTAEKSKEE